ncbi:MAG TPA: hypothetical protein DSN98_02945 [Thermoplasmata archaeon]|nr:MAG TPA: hypothetical protein DSN98_02945 [Thermoplasmata archaeon]
MRADQLWFERGVWGAKKYFSWLLKDSEKTQKKLKRYFPSEYEEILTFSGLDLEPYDILVFAYTAAFLSFLSLFILDLSIFFVYSFFSTPIDGVTIVLMGVVLISVPVIVMNLVANYPKTHARYTQIHSLGDIPEILSYLVMYLKLVPNLENSVKFAAAESSTALACDLRKLVWDMEIRVYHGINDALSSFATQWGRWSEYFKRSLHLIRSSIHERDEASRIITLDRALDVSLEGTKETMNHFANRLHQPTVILYSVGIMIPLSLVAMLPAAGLVGMRITIFQVFLIYDVLLPLFVLLYTRKILISRPAAFNPSAIPSYHPDLLAINKRQRLVFSLVIGVVISSPGAVFLLVPLAIPGGSSDALINFISNHQGLNSFFPVTLFFIWGAATAVAIYCLSVYRPYKKLRDEIKQMEKEFSDALYIIGKRISEDKSPEESFLYAARTMQGTQIAEVFRHTCYNLTAMHTNFHDALYSNEFGSLQHVHSDRIKAILRLFVEGTQKSQHAVSASLIRIADHLKQLQEVEYKITDMLYELTSTLRSTVTVFAPLIAGVTLAITMLISTILSSLSKSSSAEMITDLPASLPGASDTFMMENVRPEYFVLVIGIYLIELVFLLTRFTNGINEGDDKATFMFSLGKIMPLSIIVFSVTIIVGQFFFAQIVPAA